MFGFMSYKTFGEGTDVYFRIGCSRIAGSAIGTTAFRRYVEAMPARPIKVPIRAVCSRGGPVTHRHRIVRTRVGTTTLRDQVRLALIQMCVVFICRH